MESSLRDADGCYVTVSDLCARKPRSRRAANGSRSFFGPATNTRVEVGINATGMKASDRLQEPPAGQMCNYRVKLTDAKEVDAELIAWIQAAFNQSGG